MHSVTGFMFTQDNSRGMMLEYGSLLHYDFSLGEQKEWTLALDQSTSCTGITLMDNNGGYGVIMDVKRDSRLDASDYKKCLTKFVRRLVEGQVVTDLIMERPVPHVRFKTARDKLHELKGMVDSWQESIYALEDTEFHDILPNSWRANVTNKKKGSGNSKFSIAEDVSDIFPITKQYLSVCPASDYDSFESLGIWAGYQKYAYTADGKPMICGTEEKNHVTFVGYSVVDSGRLEECVDEIMAKVPGMLTTFTHREYNPKYNIHKNLRIASSCWPKGVWFEVPRNKLEQFRWKYGIDPNDKSKILVAFVYKKRLLSHSDVKYLENVFDWTEDVNTV